MKKVFWILEDLRWSIRCSYNFWLHGPYGVSRMIAAMPFRFIAKYLRKYGATIGNDPVIDTGIIIHRPDKQIPFRNLIIGDGVYIGHNTLFDLSDRIVLGDSVKMGAGCQVWTHFGFFRDANGTQTPEYTEEHNQVVIKNNAICYSGVIISPGVVIGEMSRIAGNSIITKDIPEYSFCGGNPATVIATAKLR